jgi:hypothetical protein
MGHYAFVTGYDDKQDLIIYQDTYQPAGSEPGANRKIKTSTFIEGWRAFNYVFVVVYPVDKENEVLALLGPLADGEQAARQALMTANRKRRLSVISTSTSPGSMSGPVTSPCSSTRMPPSLLIMRSTCMQISTSKTPSGLIG